ncbi:MAG: sulfotransferase family protein [Caulobacteraceae bacterium]
MPLEVIGAGLGRTGTMSLKLALEQLGFGPCYHMYEVFRDPAVRIAQWEAVGDGASRDWEAIFAGYCSTVDWPSATYYAELAQAYPEAKVILSRRDPEAWFRSTQATIFAPQLPDAARPPDFLRMVQKTIGVMFDLKMNDRETLLSVYERHNAEVVEKIVPERLLVWEAAEGWAPLCAFLGVPVPRTPMPKANTTEQFQARFKAAPPSEEGVAKR